MKNYFLYQSLYERLSVHLSNHPYGSHISEDEMDVLLNNIILDTEFKFSIELAHRKFELEHGSLKNKELKDIFRFLVSEGYCDPYFETLFNKQTDIFIRERIRNQLRKIN